jgi:threonine/homoserine/homoserine lactone efflux protein
METAVVESSILGALLIGIVSPGPSFLMVAHTSVALSRQNGVAAALGMGLGGVLFTSAALAGLHILLLRLPSLYLGLKILGGIYLLYTAVRLWRDAGKPLAVVAMIDIKATTTRRSFTYGLATQLSNPKTAIVYAGVFAALLPAAPSFLLLASLPPLIFMLEAGWYVIVAIAFSSDRLRSVYLSSKKWIDYAVCGVMGYLGLRLLATVY